MLDHAFQPITKSRTAPTSTFGSPTKHRLNSYTCKSNSSNSTEKQSPQNVIETNSNSLPTNAQSNIDRIEEENIGHSEIISPITSNPMSMENSFLSDDSEPPLNLRVYKDDLKKHFSSNDIGKVKPQKNKRAGSVQTFVTTNINLSIEISQPQDEPLCEAIKVTTEQSSSEIQPNYLSSQLKGVIRHPIFLTSLFVGGIVVTAPLMIRLTSWIGEFTNNFIKNYFESSVVASEIVDVSPNSITNDLFEVNTVLNSAQEKMTILGESIKLQTIVAAEMFHKHFPNGAFTIYR